MPPAHRLLLMLCLVGCVFTGWQLAARKSPAKTAQSADKDKPKSFPDTTIEHAEGSIARQALDHLGRKMDPVPPVVSLDEQAMRAAIRGNLSASENDSWATRQSVWKAMGLIPQSTDLLASFEDMILENFPVIFDPESSQLLMLEGVSPHLGQVVPVLDATRRETGKLWTDEAGGGDDARWLAGIAHHLGRGLQARRDALLDASTEESFAPPKEIEPRFFRAPIAVRELFRLLPLRGLAELEAADARGMQPGPLTRNHATLQGPPTVLGIQPAWDGTLGNLLTRILLQHFLPEETAEAAARGLVSDRVIAFQDRAENPDNLQIHWSSQWLNDGEAEQFFSALHRYFTNQSGETDNERDLSKRNFSFTIEQRVLDIRFASDRSRVIIVTLATNEPWRKALLNLTTP